MAELAAAGGGPAKAEQLADAQGIPVKFLRGILTDLRRGRLVVSQRGPEGGFELARPAESISLADIFRVVDGPLATVRDQSLRSMHYEGAAAELPVVWMAVRAGLRRALEGVCRTSLGELALARHGPGRGVPRGHRVPRPGLTRGRAVNGGSAPAARGVR
jgi:Rrf2 family protein